MIKTCVVLNGQIINVGAWDYQIKMVEISPAEYDAEGNLIKDAVFEEQATNPLPEGAITTELDIEFDENEGWYENNLENKRLKKISELYAAYESAKLGDVVSSLIAADGQPYVFEYGVDNQRDYTKIGTKFALRTDLTESIIGSKSHGKFFITREQYNVLVGDFDNHETSLYIKFKELKTQAETATEEQLASIVW